MGLLTQAPVLERARRFPSDHEHLPFYPGPMEQKAMYSLSVLSVVFKKLIPRVVHRKEFGPTCSIVLLSRVNVR